ATVHASTVSVRCDLGLGNDLGKVLFEELDFAASADVAVDLGAGNNSLLVDLQAVGPLTRAFLDVDVVGGAQKDDVTLTLHDRVGGGFFGASRLDVNVELGAGNDQFTANLDAVQAGFSVGALAEVRLNVKGGAGADTLTAHGVDADGPS